MSKSYINQVRNMVVTFGLIGSLSGFVLVVGGDVVLPKQKCAEIGTTVAGGCSGAQVNGACTQTKVNTGHDGCNNCVTGIEGESCTSYDTAQTCKKRTQTIPCQPDAGSGTCIEGTAGNWTAWSDTKEKACE